MLPPDKSVQLHFFAGVLYGRYNERTEINTEEPGLASSQKTVISCGMVAYSVERDGSQGNAIGVAGSRKQRYS